MHRGGKCSPLGHPPEVIDYPSITLTPHLTEKCVCVSGGGVDVGVCVFVGERERTIERHFRCNYLKFKSPFPEATGIKTSDIMKHLSLEAYQTCL